MHVALICCSFRELSQIFCVGLDEDYLEVEKLLSPYNPRGFWERLDNTGSEYNFETSSQTLKVSSVLANFLILNWEKSRDQTKRRTIFPTMVNMVNVHTMYTPN